MINKYSESSLYDKFVSRSPKQLEEEEIAWHLGERTAALWVQEGKVASQIKERLKNPYGLDKPELHKIWNSGFDSVVGEK